jgi:hypothetical protein
VARDRLTVDLDGQILLAGDPLDADVLGACMPPATRAISSAFFSADRDHRRRPSRDIGAHAGDHLVHRSEMGWAITTCMLGS